MALGTLQSNMCAGQREVALAMIKSSLIPRSCIMTGGTVRAELTVVMIILRVAGIAIRRRAFENIIHVALRARNTDVCAGQREIAFTVIERHLIPCSCIMAS